MIIHEPIFSMDSLLRITKTYAPQYWGSLLSKVKDNIRNKKKRESKGIKEVIHTVCIKWMLGLM